MKNKPLLFTLVSILCLIEPLIKIFYFKAMTHFDFSLIIETLMTRHGFKDIFDFWFVFPIAGALLIKIRKWTYYSFMALLCYIVYSILTYEKYTWPYNSESPFMYHYVLVGLSILVFIIFLFPDVREPFFNSRLRWWDSKDRYLVNIACNLRTPIAVYPTEILNISMTGAFIKDAAHLKTGDRVDLEFEYGGHKAVLPIEALNQHNVNGQNGYGSKFVLISFGQYFKILGIISMIKKKHKAR